MERISTYQCLYEIFSKDIFSQQYGHDYFIENDQDDQSIALVNMNSLHIILVVLFLFNSAIYEVDQHRSN